MKPEQVQPTKQDEPPSKKPEPVEDKRDAADRLKQRQAMMEARRAAAVKVDDNREPTPRDDGAAEAFRLLEEKRKKEIEEHL